MDPRTLPPRAHTLRLGKLAKNHQFTFEGGGAEQTDRGRDSFDNATPAPA